jgi:hypothetical protein
MVVVLRRVWALRRLMFGNGAYSTFNPRGIEPAESAAAEVHQ